MPDDIDQPTPDQLLSVSSSITLPYDELKELKAAAAAASETGLSVNVFLFIYLNLYHCFNNVCFLQRPSG